MHPPGTIAIPCGELGRFSAFTYSMGCLQYPVGTTISMMQSLSIPRNLNEIVRDALAKSATRWVHLQADDHVFEPELLIKLLNRLFVDDVDVVVPLILRRRPPFAPVLFKRALDSVEDLALRSTDDLRKRGIEYEPFAYDELPASGLLPVYAAGTGGMTIKREVFERIAEMQGHDMWFEYRAGEAIAEDVDFCKKIREAGFRIHADMEARMGHIGLYQVWPALDDEGKWAIQFQFGEGPDGALNAIYVKPGEREE